MQNVLTYYGGVEGTDNSTDDNRTPEIQTGHCGWDVKRNLQGNDKNKVSYFELLFDMNTYSDCPPPPPKKKNTIGIWVSIAKESFMKSEKSNRIIKLWLFFFNSVKTPYDLAK